MVVQIHNAIVCAGRRGQAVGVLRIGEIAERDAVDGLVGVVVIGLQIVKAHCDHIVRHGSPVCHGCLNARRPLVVAVIVGETEHAEAQIIQRVGDLAGGGEHRIAAGGELVVDERLLIEPVHIKPVVVALHGCVSGVKIVVVAAALLSLQKDTIVDQVVARGGKVHGLDGWRRLGGRLRCSGWFRLCRHIHDYGLWIDRGQGHSLIADAQQRADNYAADAQCDDRAGGKVVAVHSHISLPRSRSVIV